MPRDRAVPRLVRPDAVEEAAIRRGIQADADNPEWSEADFAAAKQARDLVPGAVDAMRARQAPCAGRMAMLSDLSSRRRCRPSRPLSGFWQRPGIQAAKYRESLSRKSGFPRQMLSPEAA